MVQFRDGLLTLRARRETLQRVVSAISMEVGLRLALSDNLRPRPLSIERTAVRLDTALAALLVEAQVSNYRWVYQADPSAAGGGFWATELVRPATGSGAGSAGPAAVDVPLAPPPDVAPGEVLVKFATGISPEAVARENARLGVEVLRALPKVGLYRLKLPAGQTVDAFLKAQEGNPAFQRVEANPIARVQVDAEPPNDPLLAQQWALARIGAPAAWAVTTGRREVVIAIIDTGVDLAHPDLQTQLVQGQNILAPRTPPQDDNGHGTAMAGIIGAAMNNGVGIVGVCPGCRLMPIKALDADGVGTYADVMEGILYAADHGARVLNLSVGGAVYSEALREAVDYARTAGAVVVAAAGNSGADTPVYPAAYPGVLGVAAVDRDGTPWAGSNRGAHVSLAAPGVDIVTTGLGGSYPSVTGTSPASAHVAGVAALMTAAHLDATGSQVEEALLRTAEDLGDTGRDDSSGFGIVRAERATQVGVTRVVDVAVNRVVITPRSFQTGDTVSVAIAVSNLGTDVVNIPTITLTANGRVVAAEAGSGTLASGESATVTLSWVIDVLPGSEGLVVEASASPTPGETSLVNNHRQVQPTYDPTANVYVLYANNPFVHSWVANRAYELLKATSPSHGIVAEISANPLLLWGGATSCSLFGKTSANVWCADRPNGWYDKYSPPGGWASSAETGGSILEGSWEEDEDWEPPFPGFLAHFWNPDASYDYGLQDATFKSALQRASLWWNEALANYNPSNPTLAYYYLGRVIHLLGDMGVPDHAHNDPHPGPDWPLGLSPSPNDISNYEGYTAAYYRAYLGSGSPKDVDALPLALPPGYLGSSGIDPLLGRLFYNMAQFTQHYDSSDVDGDSVKAGGMGKTAEAGQKRQQYPALMTLGNRVDFGTTPTVRWCDLGFGCTWYALAECNGSNSTACYDVSRYYGKIYVPQGLWDRMGILDKFEVAYRYKGSLFTETCTNFDNGSHDVVPDRFLGGQSGSGGQASEILPENIRYVAGLLQLFWQETHPAPTVKTLSVTVNGNGSVSAPPGINSCTGTCQADFQAGSPVTLTAAPNGGAQLSYWSGACSGSSLTCQVAMDAAKTVAATFTGSAPGSYTLTVSKAGAGSGTVTSTPSGISCGTSCSNTSHTYSSGTPVTLSATAAAGSTFAGWSDACGGVGSCPVTMNSVKGVTATFTPVAVQSGNPGELIKGLPNPGDVYWLQNNRRYHVILPSVIDDMAGMDRWGWGSLQRPVSSLPGTQGPDFIGASSWSNGLLIRAQNDLDRKVYEIMDGQRHWVACEAALPNGLSSFPDVIEVSGTLMSSSSMPPLGAPYTNGCPIPCTGFSIFPSSLPVSPDSSAGSQLITITGVPFACDGNWTASGDGDWLTVNNPGGSLTSSNTEDSVRVSWDTNSWPPARSSSATVANHDFPVTQGGAPPPVCSTFEIWPVSKNVASAAGQSSVTITGLPSGCQGRNWSASGNGDWLHVSQAVGSGPGQITLSWDQNQTASSRSDSVPIAQQMFTVTQSPGNQPPVANAGPDLTVPLNSLTTLNGGGSSDPDGIPSPLTYAWSQVSGPAVTLSGANTASPTFTPASAGTYIFELRVSDGSATATDQVTITAGVGIASYDATLGVPKCGSVGSLCDSGSLLVGRAGLGPEPNQPNTIHASCADSTTGMFHSDESNDRIRISTLDGSNFAGGKTVQVEATVWAWTTPSDDSLEIYQAANANSPVWTLVATLHPSAAGARTLAATYVLPAGTLQAVRARFRYNTPPGPCGPGGPDSYDDQDDLVFAVGAPTTQGWISGAVTNASTGASLASVRVDIYNPSGSWVANGYTNNFGFYAISSGLPSGTYYARTSNSQGYVDEWYDGIACVDCSVTSSTPISVTLGTTALVDFGLARGGRVSGTVTDASTGPPLASVQVNIYNSAGSYVTYGSTNGSGAYTTAAGLPMGTYYARTANSQGYVEELYDGMTCAVNQCAVTSGTGIVIADEATTPGVDFRLASGGRISGVITDAATGTPLAGALMRIYDGSGTYLTSGTTNASGAYTTGSGLLAGSYYGRTANARGYLDEVYNNIPCPAGVCAPTGGTPINVAAGATKSGINVALLRAPIQTNDEIVGAMLVSTWPYSSAEDTRTATSNVSDPVHSCGSMGRDSNTVWFRFVSTFNGTVWVNTVNSNYDTVLTAYGGTTSVGPELACNDDSNGTTQSDISFSVSSGQSYLIEVSAFGSTSAGGTLILTVGPAAAPVVTTQPQGQTIASGQEATLSVVATGTAPLGYQWYQGNSGNTGSPIAGATSSSYTTSSLTSTTAFWVRVSNAQGTADSNTATVTVGSIELPVIAIVDGQVVEGDSGSRSLGFTVTLGPASVQTVTVDYATSDVTATAGSDYQAKSGTLSFAPGETTKTVNVSVLGDTQAESNESFLLTLYNPAHATIQDATGFATILDNDTVGGTPRGQAVWHDWFAVDSLETPYVGDFNGDGLTDIITFTRQNPAAVGDVYVALSDGAKFGPNTKWHDWFAISTDEQVVIGDYDGDGKDDIATWLGKTTRQVYVALSIGVGMLRESVWVSPIGFDPTDVLMAGDVNGDGRDDLVCFARKQGKVYVALSTGWSFEPPVVWHGFFAVSTYERPRVADVTGDGRADIVTFATNSPAAQGDVYVAVSDGTQFVDLNGVRNSSSKWHDWFGVNPAEEVRVGDLNGDGRDDFFTFLPPPLGQCYTVLSLGTSMGPNVLWPGVLTPHAKDRPFVGDANGDGKADVIVFAQGEGRVYVSLAK